jgi:type IV pilus assembly protein PilE
MVRKYCSGFTLIELMIVVAIIAIIAMIAYPSYQDSVRRAKRIDAQSTMMDIASKLQKYKIARFSFEKADGSFVTLADIGATNQIPSTGTALYTIALSNQGLGTWTLTATPKSSTAQFGDGHIVINHRGERCWTKGSDKNGGTACIPSATSNWDGR